MLIKITISIFSTTDGIRFLDFSGNWFDVLLIIANKVSILSKKDKLYIMIGEIK